MADIVLAEFNGSVWLVAGDTHIDRLLANTLPAEMTVEFVECASKEEVLALWLRDAEPEEIASDPWLINPAIVARLRRSAEGFVVQFAEWSAMLDQPALAVISAAAEAATRAPEMPVTLADAIDPAVPMAADLAGLRAKLIEERLVEAGLARERIGRLRREPGERERIEIVIGPVT